MRIKVINLASRGDRRAQFLKWNTRPDIDIAFVDAAVGSELDPEAMVRDGLTTASARLTPGAVGCAFSHRAVWREAAAAAAPMIICEDDACLRADFSLHAAALMRGLGDNWDLLFLGYNTDAVVAAETPEGLKLLLHFDEAAKRAPGFFDRFSGLQTTAPAALACYQAWGLLCYAVTPRGAARLLATCYPIAPEREILMFGQNRTVRPYGIDGMINAVLQREPIAAFCALPALAVSLNDLAGSDVARG